MIETVKLFIDPSTYQLHVGVATTYHSTLNIPTAPVGVATTFPLNP